MLIIRTPKGWTGPKFVKGKPVENTWRAHQVPLDQIQQNPKHLRRLDGWMRSYKPAELFDEKGHFRADLADIAPKGRLRMGMNPHSNGALLLKPLNVPNFRDFAVKTEGPRAKDVESTRVLGHLLHAVMEANRNQKNFRVFGPDETASNRLGDVITGTGKTWMAATLPVDENLSETGRVIEILSEQMCQGWLEGYLLTGRHGFFSCYEAFIHIIDSRARIQGRGNNHDALRHVRAQQHRSIPVRAGRVQARTSPRVAVECGRAMVLRKHSTPPPVCSRKRQRPARDQGLALAARLSHSLRRLTQASLDLGINLG
jgi:phosphoketolase